MKPPVSAQPRERKTTIIHFRVPSSVEAQLADQIDPVAGQKSINDVARAFTMQTLADRECQRRLKSFNADALADYQMFEGDAGRVLPALPARTFRTCVTSPPYWKKRDYQHLGQIGREADPVVYVNRLADIFMEVYRVLSEDGTLWINIDDSYRNRELVGIPWRLALELQRRGWHWRAEIVWAKASTPEPVKNRPTRAHEAMLLFTKKKKYFYDFNAILEPHDSEWAVDCIRKAQASGINGRPKTNPFSKDLRRLTGARGITRAEYGTLMNPNGRNKRDVWSIKAGKYRGAHTAVMPVALAEICIRAASAPGDIVIDPFAGMGTTGVAALQNGRRFVGVELLTGFIDETNARLKKSIVRPPLGITNYCGAELARAFNQKYP